MVCRIDWRIIFGCRKHYTSGEWNVGASGSGAQEVGCLVESMGDGVSSLIGTGGRDLTPEINGMMMKQGMHLLDKDKNTEVIVLVSKLADLSVMEKMLDEADSLTKPVVAVFLGSNEKTFGKHKANIVFSLKEAAVKAIELLGIDTKDFYLDENHIKEIAKQEVKKYTPNKNIKRSLLCGTSLKRTDLLQKNYQTLCIYQT